MERLRALIKEAMVWRNQHKQAGRQIETLAAEIRLKALRDALAAIETDK